MPLLRSLPPNSETDRYKDCAPTEHGFGFLKPEPERRSRPYPNPALTRMLPRRRTFFGLPSQELVPSGIDYCGMGRTGLLY